MSGNDMDRPFQEFGARVDPGEFDVAHPTLCGGVDVFGCVIAPGGVELPGVIMRFAHFDGSGFTQPIMLIATPNQLAKLPQVVSDAVTAAIAATKGAAQDG